MTATSNLSQIHQLLILHNTILQRNSREFRESFCRLESNLYSFPCSGVDGELIHREHTQEIFLKVFKLSIVIERDGDRLSALIDKVNDLSDVISNSEDTEVDEFVVRTFEMKVKWDTFTSDPHVDLMKTVVDI